MYVCSVAHSYLILCDSMDCSPPDSSALKFSRQEYWSGLPLPPPGYLLDPGIETVTVKSLPHWQVGSLPLVPPGKPNTIVGTQI